MATFVLVHGSYHGGWCWRDVSGLLRREGHDVYAVTLTGLGERSHLLRPDVNLDTHATDVVQVLEFEDLHDVTLVGHSYGGIVVTAAASRVPGRVSRLVFLDSPLAVEGESGMDVHPRGAEFRARMRVVDDVEVLPVPDGERLGIDNDDDLAWVRSKMTDQPFAAVAQPLKLTTPIDPKLPKAYILCLGNAAGKKRAYLDRMNPAENWTYIEIDTGHDAMVSAPGELARILAKVAEPEGTGAGSSAPLWSPPRLSGVRQLVADIAAASAFYEDVLGLHVGDGPRPDWRRVDIGGGQSLFLVAGGTELRELGDRWEQQGVIPILRTTDIDGVVKVVDEAGVQWVNRVFDYQMMGSGRLGYFHGPSNQPVGVQTRLADSFREEDINFARSALSTESASSSLALHGMGWMIFQTADLDATRRFYVTGFGWGERRGTEGFGNMLAITDVVTLQTAFRGRAEEKSRHLASDPALPVLEGSTDALLARVAAYGGSEGPPVDGCRTILDHEGHGWCVIEPREASRAAGS